MNQHVCSNPSHLLVQPLCYYYVLNGVVYQAPDVYTLMQSRLVGVVDPLREALSKTLESLRLGQQFHCNA